MSVHYRLTTLGSLGLYRVGDEESPGPVLGVGKPLALITYLALSARRSATREHIVDILWADAEPDMGRRNLRQALYQIRRLLGEDFITGDAELLTVTSSLATDWHEFTTAVERGELTSAVELYGGPFFPAFAAPGGAEFERWADLERQRLQGIHLRSMESLARSSLGQHRVREGVAQARRLRDAAPDREVGWRLLMEGLVAAGDWVHAAAEADACEAMLRHQGREPEPATLAMIRAARQAPPSTGAAAPRLVAEMVGREREFAIVASAWGRATAGHGTHIHVTGAAGIGKTRLLRDAAARVASVGGTVIALRANQGERDLRFALAGEIARALAELPGAPGVAPAIAGILVDLDPALSSRFPAARPPANAPEDVLRLRTVAIAELVAAVAEDRPLALMLDDLHWADEPSRQIVAGLASRLATRNALLVSAARPVPDGDLGLRPEETLTLRALSVREIGMLVETIAPLPEALLATGLLQALHDATGGVPLLVLETLQLAWDTELLVRGDAAWAAPDPHALFQMLAGGSALTRRLDPLSAAERRLLLLVAAAGQPLPSALVAAVAGKDFAGEAPSLGTLERGGLLVRHQSGAWEPSHDLIGEALLEAATPDEVRQAHAELGLALAGVAGDDEAVLRRALRHLARGDEREQLVRSLAVYLRLRRKDGDDRRATAVAEEALAGTVAPADVRRLVGSLPVGLRVTRPARVRAAAALAVAGAIATAWWLTSPVRLEVVTLPVFAEDLGDDQRAVVEVTDRLGMAAALHDDTVVVGIATGGDVFRLEGRTRVATTRGRAVFDSVRIAGRPDAPGIGDGYVVLQFSYPGLPPLRSDSLIAGIGATGVFLDSGYVNGQAVSPASRTVRIAPGDPIRGFVYLRYLTNYSPASLVMATIPNWGDRTETFAAADAIPPRTARDTAHIRLQIPGPQEPGRYWVAFITALETEARFVASGTNWMLGTPSWHDGNDIVDLSDEQIAELNARGHLSPEWDLPTPEDPGWRAYYEQRVVPSLRPEERVVVRRPNIILGTAIEVVVER